MKTLRLVVGIICCVLFCLIMLQSCVAGVSDSLSKTGEMSGTSGMLLAIFMLIAGIIGIAGRSSNKATIVAVLFFLIAGLVGRVSIGSFSDLKVWSMLCFILAVIFLASVFITKKKKTITVSE